MQVVCNAQGHLQIVAKYPSDPYTAFDLPGFDPSAHIFSPSRSQGGLPSERYMELLDAVDRRYAELMERVEKDYRLRGVSRSPYQAALTATSRLLSEDGPRRFYVGTVLPALEQAVHGQPRERVWDRVSEFHQALCADTWAITGMNKLLREAEAEEARCSGRFSIFRRWMGRC
ncbi:hypothetical protein VTK26DRAFT_9474 [Humicola hyalothermophila]